MKRRFVRIGLRNWRNPVVVSKGYPEVTFDKVVSYTILETLQLMSKYVKVIPAEVPESILDRRIPEGFTRGF